MKAGLVQAYNDLRNLVLGLLKRQGKTAADLALPAGLPADDQARREAAAALAVDGPLSAENVSDNIVQFALAVAEGAKSKLGLLQDAIAKGFAEAEVQLGTVLPEVSRHTNELVRKKLVAWAAEA